MALYHEELDTVYGSGEVGVFLDMLFEAFLGWDKVRLLSSKEETIDQSDLLRFHWALEDLRKHRPIQHIIGYTDFCGCKIVVSPDVLIPRPETEEMIKSFITGTSPIGEGCRILDLCTGSGCIAIALKKAFPGAEVAGVDISPKALEIARENARNNGVEVCFIEGDVLGGVDGLKGWYELIVSNPPYVMERERTQMAANVLDYDPALALFVPDDDPLRFYKAIAEIAKRHLSPRGMLVVEINEALAEETCTLLSEYGLCSAIHIDFRGKQRWISAVWNQ